MRKMPDFDLYKERIRTGVEQSLSELFATYPDSGACRVARYIAMGKGHKWRAMTVIASGEIFHNNAFHLCMPGACGVELAHAASLLLDDLPSMDNAQIRRGQPCAHLVFPRWAVDMAPAFLVNMAYISTLDNPLVTYERRVISALMIGQVGAKMSLGQEIDLTKQVDFELNELLDCYRLKSGSLYAVAAKAGALLCGASDDEATLLYDCGMNLGLSYQLLDDVADVVARTDDVGKDSGMDKFKCTAVDLFGIDGTNERARQFVQNALSKLETFGPNADNMRSLISQASWAPI